MQATMQTPADQTLERAWAALESVPDPEIPVVSIRELGILRDVRRADDGQLEVVITPTYSGCPAMSQIAEDVAHALDAAQIAPYRIATTLSPAWTTDWITDEAREKLRAYGIAPPTGNCGGAAHGASAEKPITFMRRPDPLPAPVCPRCGSKHTERLAQFGSTACKALYRCLDCREPFDYFKPY
ncbi:ring-1,2-phenylacetyl-CoA epoxidase subunit PaaD [Paraburkholderia bannensis]|uniref:Ring-1,2-phenylacetyl-CoA epoxidase subunit PaaD n=1 Tax=Paraburkholderia bannensis TaxID=765414 RepID=A0A7W9U4E7_9BURK|nr:MULTISPECIES: 1,2-phenylacetyl-CoA epoxidase subunit PaaD [Paraburkholderia]MBB3261827.1 ring-1,2-phenylacetyl-CoA epoxidase subunit PaaD [Paraburkholderia sp. WP4_3_2]MBB6106822.1 ring-1,2-phenylacetyl-CoA epoxidase subunit PaaD [Paraburkholderia bannensis]